MPNEVLNVSTGKPRVAGSVYRAPKGTTLPTSADEALNGAFSSLGYVSEDGVTNNNTAENDEIKAWGGDVVLITQTGKPDEFTITLIEALNGNVLGTVYGDSNVTVNAVAGTIVVNASAEQLAEQAYVIDMAMRGGALKRIVISAATLKEVGEIVYKDDEAVGYKITLACMPDANGYTHKEYIKLAGTQTTGLSISDSTKTVAKNATYQLTATTTPAGRRVIWGTSDPTKATVDASGLVTGVAAGNATITAYCDGLTASCAVTVTG